MKRYQSILAVGAILSLIAFHPAAGQLVAYVSSLTEDAIVRMHDLDEDGDYNDLDETATFFGPGNAAYRHEPFERDRDDVEATGKDGPTWDVGSRYGP